MGLAERRAAERFRTEEFPGWKSKLDEAAHFPVPVDVEWSELANNEFHEQYTDLFARVYFGPLVRALTAITVDDLGIEALREGLSRIVVRNTYTYASETGFSFADGVLTIDHRGDANIDHEDDRAKWLQQLLEKNL
ncbi:hypothetical protein Val02_12660 [Virgisporangium aliadipatigenens]|uniref:Uncharacterized protein n=1 Tax=Virgisporangium aliadipatigenens TaxID=741659 RepID=A0A8J4DN15_9ACTN|nr:hypothetical protein [Virgisporangium aliadipatigenens]GIJ44380.1 hypothetical protein Val02_12660 [Virgisporangium aliadipatigenens]